MEQDRKNIRGYSLVEVIIACGIAAVLFLGGATALKQFGVIGKEIVEKAERDSSIRGLGPQMREVIESAGMAMSYEHLPIHAEGCLPTAPCLRQKKNGGLFEDLDAATRGALSTLGSNLFIEFFRDQFADESGRPIQHDVLGPGERVWVYKSAFKELPEALRTRDVYATWPLVNEESLPFVVLRSSKTAGNFEFVDDAATASPPIGEGIPGRYVLYRGSSTDFTLDRLRNVPFVIYNAYSQEQYVIQVAEDVIRCQNSLGANLDSVCKAILDSNKQLDSALDRTLTDWRYYYAIKFKSLDEIPGFKKYLPDLKVGGVNHWHSQINEFYLFPTAVMSLYSETPLKKPDPLLVNSNGLDIRRVGNFFHSHPQLNGLITAVPIEISSFYLRKSAQAHGKEIYQLVSSNFQGGTGTGERETVWVDSLEKPDAKNGPSWIVMFGRKLGTSEIDVSVSSRGITVVGGTMKNQLPALNVGNPSNANYLAPGRMTVSSLLKCGDTDVSLFYSQTSQAPPLTGGQVEFLTGAQTDVKLVMGFWTAPDVAESTANYPTQIPTSGSWIPIGYDSAYQIKPVPGASPTPLPPIDRLYQVNRKASKGSKSMYVLLKRAMEDVVSLSGKSYFQGTTKVYAGVMACNNFVSPATGTLRDEDFPTPMEVAKAFAGDPDVRKIENQLDKIISKIFPDNGWADKPSDSNTPPSDSAILAAFGKIDFCPDPGEEPEVSRSTSLMSVGVRVESSGGCKGSSVGAATLPAHPLMRAAGAVLNLPFPNSAATKPLGVPMTPDAYRNALRASLQASTATLPSLVTVLESIPARLNTPGGIADCRNLFSEIAPTLGPSPKAWWEPFRMGLVCKVIGGHKDKYGWDYQKKFDELFSPTFVPKKEEAFKIAKREFVRYLIKGAIYDWALTAPLTTLSPPNVRCFKDGDSYIHTTLASVPIEMDVFLEKGKEKLKVKKVSQMLHPEGNFATGGYQPYVTTPVNSGNAHTIFGMTGLDLLSSDPMAGFKAGFKLKLGVSSPAVSSEFDLEAVNILLKIRSVNLKGACAGSRFCSGFPREPDRFDATYLGICPGGVCSSKLSGS